MNEPVSVSVLGPRSRRDPPSIPVLRFGFVPIILLAMTPTPVRADPSLSEIAAKIAKLEEENRQIKNENREMKAAIAGMRGETRTTRERVRVVTERIRVQPAPLLATYAPSEGTPVLVTPEKKMQFGELTITPGGFVAAESVFRSRATNAEMTNFPSNIPFGPGASISEGRFSARQTRPAVLVEGALTRSMAVAGYAEIDFNNQGISSNYNQANAWVPRIRNLYAQLDATDYGLHLLVGQNWSLATTNSKGITPRNEALPPAIDGNTITGFAYKRQAQVRLTKDFDRKLWLSLSVENPQTTYNACTTGINATASAGTGITGITCDVVGTTTDAGVTATAGGPAIQTLSTNVIPDVIGKAAYELEIGERNIHVEGYGILRHFNDRVAYANGTAVNYNTQAYGGGFGVIIPVLPRRLDFQGSGLVGRGLGSYGPAQLPDATFKSNGAPAPIGQQMFFAGLTAHVTPSLDVYAFGGVETQQPDYFANGATLSGSGVPNGNNSGCFNTVTAGTCGGATKRILELTGGFWDKVYRGAFGEVRAGLQYAYFQRQLFQGNGGGAAALPYAPVQSDHVVMTSFRYYPFQ